MIGCETAAILHCRWMKRLMVTDCLLIMYIRYIDAEELREDLLFCKQLIGRVTADKMFKIIDTYLKDADLKWEDCVGICTDGDQVMAWKRGGLQTLIKRISPALQLSPELNNVLMDVITTVNHIKTQPVKAQIFFCTVGGNGLRPHSCFVSQPGPVTWEGFFQDIWTAR